MKTLSYSTFAVCALGWAILSPASSAFADGIGSPECIGYACTENDEPLLWFQKDETSQAVWASAGSEVSGSKSFKKWLESSNSSRSLPAFRNTLSLNCWEYVLYTGLKTTRLSFETAKSLHAARTRGEKLSEHLGETIGIAKYTIRGSTIRITWPAGIAMGDVVFMDETSHVVQLTGQRDDQGHQLVVSFSARPIWGDGSSERPVPNTRPELTTIESLIGELKDLYPDVPSDWQKIDLKIVRFPQRTK